MLAQKSPRATSSIRLMLSTSRWHPGERRIIHRHPQGAEVVMPPLFCPFERDEREGGDAVSDGLWRWLDRFTGPEAPRVRQAMKRHGIDTFLQRACSRSSLEVGHLVAAYCGFLYLFDDGVVNNPTLDAAAAVERIHDALAALDGRRPAHGDLAFIAGVTDILHEAGWIDRRVAARIHRHTRRYLLGCQWEILSRARPPSLPTYLRIRRDSSAVFPCLDFALLDFAHDGAIAALDSPLVIALETMANNVISWSNDIIGMSQERSSGAENLVTALRRERELDWQGAVNAAAEMCDAENARVRGDARGPGRVLWPRAPALPRRARSLRGRPVRVDERLDGDLSPLARLLAKWREAIPCGRGLKRLDPGCPGPDLGCPGLLSRRPPPRSRSRWPAPRR